MRSSSSKNGVRLYNGEAFDIGFPFDRFSTPYLSALFRDSTSFPKYLAYSLLISHISASRSSSADSGTGHAFCYSSRKRTVSFFYYVCCEMGVVNTRPYVVIMVLSVEVKLYFLPLFVDNVLIWSCFLSWEFYLLLVKHSWTHEPNIIWL